VRDGWATKVDFSGDIHKVWINETKSCIVKRLLFRLSSAKYLGLPSEQHYLKWVVEFLHVQFVMVSIEIKSSNRWSRDSACEEAHYLSKLCKSNHVGA
jgi:thioredoxin reductase (NADPH)